MNTTISQTRDAQGAGHQSAKTAMAVRAVEGEGNDGGAYCGEVRGNGGDDDNDEEDDNDDNNDDGNVEDNDGCGEVGGGCSNGDSGGKGDGSGNGCSECDGDGRDNGGCHGDGDGPRWLAAVTAASAMVGKAVVR